MLTVPFYEDETITSFVSRLAIANFVEDVWEFCRHMGLSYRRIIDGELSEIRRVLDLAGHTSIEIGSRHVERIDRHVQINGEALSRASFHRYRLRYCPHCIEDDIKTRTGDPLCRTYGRLHWCVIHVRTCSKHHVPLLQTDISALAGSHNIAAMIAARPSATFQNEPQQFSPFEAYIEDRLWGRSERKSWLDRLPLFVAGKLCEMVGATKLFGKSYFAEEISEIDWIKCAQTGFEILSPGEDSFRDFLRSLHIDFWKQESSFGGRLLYGRLYERLAFEIDDAAYDGIRDIMRDVALSSVPFAIGAELFGPVTVRRLHSIHSASRQYGIHAATVRKLLVKAGLLDANQSIATDSRTVFAAARVDELMEDFTSSMKPAAAREYLSTGRTLWRTLARGNYVELALASGPDVSLTPFYFKRDLDGFLDRATKCVTREFNQEAGYLTFAEAVKAANCRFEEILDLMLGGSLKNVSTNPGKMGLDAFRFDVEEIRRLTMLPDHGGLSLSDAEKRLRLARPVLAALIDQGFIEAEHAINPVNRCLQRIVRPEVADRFAAEYVTLIAYAKERQRHFAGMKRDLTAAGILPVITKESVGSTFYRRAELP
ncbi:MULTISPECIES: TniQ family protein [unclassified Rhizobium]|uniref:TniQ family protein n=1 Tax=unclassified Rhizobium TaxID=2613769 RepID=UPI000CDF4B96|nr:MULTISPECIES: TniQ family protein [Rhizobium]AVA21281.1 TniQ family protein [Rhizobium sp. NXC24]UWU22449.1 TniQ family protein [Rhizobium tropici]